MHPNLGERQVAESHIESRLATENQLWHGDAMAEMSSSFAFIISLRTL